MRGREFIESFTVLICGILLISPKFNIIYDVPFLEFIGNIPDGIISHFALALIPTALLYLIDMFRAQTD